MLPGRWGRIRGMGGAQAFAPLREGGAARWKTVAGVHIRSGWKGRRGEYCGLPSRHASAWSIRRGLEFFVAGIELCLAATAPRSTPPSRPLLLAFCQSWTSHPWPRHPPLGGGECPVALLSSLHLWDSRGGSTIIPEEPKSATLPLYPPGEGRASARPRRAHHFADRSPRRFVALAACRPSFFLDRAPGIRHYGRSKRFTGPGPVHLHNPQEIA